MDINSYYNCKTMVNIALINFLALELCIRDCLPGRASFMCFSCCIIFFVCIFQPSYKMPKQKLHVFRMHHNVSYAICVFPSYAYIVLVFLICYSFLCHCLLMSKLGNNFEISLLIKLSHIRIYFWSNVAIHDCQQLLF